MLGTKYKLDSVDEEIHWCVSGLVQSVLIDLITLQWRQLSVSVPQITSNSTV